MRNLLNGSCLILCLILQFGVNAQSINKDHSAARVWMDAYVQAIKEDGLGPTIHARNMFHLSVAMYDSWEVYNGDKLNTFFLGKTFGNYDCEFEGFPPPENLDSARNVTINFAAYRFIMGKYEFYSSKVRNSDVFIALFDSLGFNFRFTSTDYSKGSPAALGNYIATQLVQFAIEENVGDEDGYEAEMYNPINVPLRPELTGNPSLTHKNRWQPLAVRKYIDAKGWDATLRDWNYLLILPRDIFLTPQWGRVTPFAMGGTERTSTVRNGYEFIIYNDPGAPPFIGLDAENTKAYQWNFALVASWGGHNDPDDETMIDISPRSIGTSKGLLPDSYAEYVDFFNLEDGGCKTKPNKVNPFTDKPYEPNLVKRGDYTRLIAEYWVDGVNTLSPPGHWVDNFNATSDSPRFEKRWGGKGNVLNDLEWDIKSYFALTGALHDAGISAWSAKSYYDYIRPISAIRWMSQKGQCSDSTLSNYHLEGIPLIEGRIEMITKKDPLVGENKENLGKIKVYSWNGPDNIDDPKIDVAGAGWILAGNWWPYQRYSFATPPFAGYISGHSTFSVAAAEIISSITGDPFFPGGLKEITFEKDSFLEFENGPSETITLQWATYREAADETCLSRIWGGIHPPVDDIEGRKIGEKVAVQAFEYANQIFKGKTD